MFGFFKGLFGNSVADKVVETAFEAAILDELEAETTVPDVEPVPNDTDNSKENFQTAVKTIQKICCSLEKAANTQETLGVEGLLPAFYACIMYAIVARVRCAKEEKFDVFDSLIELCPASLGMLGQEVFTHIERNDDVGQLIMAMKNFPLIILDLAHKTGRRLDGREFLDALALVFISAGEFCEHSKPGKGFQEEARKTGAEWMESLNAQIMG